MGRIGILPIKLFNLLAYDNSNMQEKKDRCKFRERSLCKADLCGVVQLIFLLITFESAQA